jgi:hypothetical protein
MPQSAMARPAAHRPSFVGFITFYNPQYYSTMDLGVKDRTEAVIREHQDRVITEGLNEAK